MPVESPVHAATSPRRESFHQWHVITPEYPPQVGGVSDYVQQLSEALSHAGDEVHVWCPASSSSARGAAGVILHPSLGRFTPQDLKQAGRELDRFPQPRRVLVQWVPHGYGYHSMNVAFCEWLWRRSWRYGDEIDIMVHEPCLAFRVGAWRQNFPALIHRLMTILLLRAAHRVWVAIPAWERRWQPYRLGRRVPFRWLPVPSNISISQNSSAIDAARKRYRTAAGPLIGHFGTYGAPVTSILEPVLLALADDPGGRSVMLIGAGSESFRERLVRTAPRLAGTIVATGTLSAEQVSCHIAACDLLIQPYPDGVTSRRTSFMVGLAHGKPIVTTAGSLTEPLWLTARAAALAPVGDTNAFVELIRKLERDMRERELLAAAAKELYEQRFDLRHVVSALLSTNV